MGLWKDVQHAAQHAADQVTGAAEDAGDTAEDLWDDATKGGQKVIDAVGDVAKTLVTLITDNTLAIRNLRPKEKTVAKGVYHASLPSLDNILIASRSGKNGRAFTVPASFLLTILEIVCPPADLFLWTALLLGFKSQERYIIFLGKNGYNDGLTGEMFNEPGDVLIHELGHVWQGFNNAFTWSYVFNSIYYQTQCGECAYNYTEGDQWDSYEVEQQASIVEDWYAAGSSTTDSLYPYIRDNIRPGNPHAHTNL